MGQRSGELVKAVTAQPTVMVGSLRVGRACPAVVTPQAGVDHSDGYRAGQGGQPG